MADAEVAVKPLVAADRELTLELLFAELVDEHMAYGDLLRLVRSVRQSYLEGKAGLAEDFVSPDLALPVERLVYELLCGKGMGYLDREVKESSESEDG